MIFDTGSEWLWIASSDCINCPDLPNFERESSQSNQLMSQNPKTLYYGSGSVTGLVNQDMICISNDYCSNTFSFMSILSQSGLDSLHSSGIVGISPRSYDP
jgi:hypothetical protein